MIIFGTRRQLLQLAMITLVCGRCGHTAAHAVIRRVLKFTLFFVPLFPISSKYFTQCTACGVQFQLTKEQAVQLQGAPQAPTGQGLVHG